MFRKRSISRVYESWVRYAVSQGFCSTARINDEPCHPKAGVLCEEVQRLIAAKDVYSFISHLQPLDRGVNKNDIGFNSIHFSVL